MREKEKRKLKVASLLEDKLQLFRDKVHNGIRLFSPVDMI